MEAFVRSLTLNLSRPAHRIKTPRCALTSQSLPTVRRPCRARAVHTSATSKRLSNTQQLPIVFGVLASATAAYAFLAQPETRTEKHAEELELDVPELDIHAAKYIRLSEIKNHGRDAERKWVYRGDRVYDITEWIALHPGGEIILQAVGGPIDPYWNIFSVHKKKDVYDILEQYYIANIDPADLVDGHAPEDEVVDPFATDPKRDPDLLVRTAQPCNAETPPAGLLQHITPTSLFYVRNHFWVPQITRPNEHKVSIELPDGDVAEYTIEDLRKKFKPATITATLQCSGNRRSHMAQDVKSKPISGLSWNVGAISTATWTGARLRDVLADAGFDVNEIPEDVKHVQFEAAESYGASIPIEKAVDRFGDVLLAYEMNGEPLQPDHGAPVRALVPGHVAARSVKWLSKIILSEDESWKQWQRKDYKSFGPNVGSKPDWDSAPSIQEMPVQSAITSISKDGDYKLEGYAYSGGGRRVIRVDVSPDGGKTWQQAEISPYKDCGRKTWDWQLWSARISEGAAKESFLVKAVDESYNTQPEGFEAQYNYRGNLGNAWHKVAVPA